MTGINHALTGATLGIVVGQPIFGVILAIFSHFILDILPHFGISNGSNVKAGRSFYIVSVVDVVLLLLFVAVMLTLQPAMYGFLLLYATAAIAPDFAWVYRFIFKESWGRKPSGPRNRFNTFHSDIQWGERPYGWIYELLWLITIGHVFIQVM